MAFDHLLADRTGKMGVNVIREISKVIAQHGMVSLTSRNMSEWIRMMTG